MKVDNQFGLPMLKNSKVENIGVNLSELLFGRNVYKFKSTHHIYLTRRQYALMCNGKSRVRKKWRKVQSKTFHRHIKGTLSNRLKNIVENGVIIREL